MCAVAKRAPFVTIQFNAYRRSAPVRSWMSMGFEQHSATTPDLRTSSKHIRFERRQIGTCLKTAHEIRHRLFIGNTNEIQKMES
jgi:hypothetical protein